MGKPALKLSIGTSPAQSGGERLAVETQHNASAGEESVQCNTHNVVCCQGEQVENTNGQQVVAATCWLTCGQQQPRRRLCRWKGSLARLVNSTRLSALWAQATAS